MEHGEPSGRNDCPLRQVKPSLNTSLERAVPHCWALAILLDCRTKQPSSSCQNATSYASGKRQQNVLRNIHARARLTEQVARKSLD